MTTTDPTEPVAAEEQLPTKRRTPAAHHVIGAALLAVVAIIAIAAAVGGNDTSDLRVSDAGFETSPGGRVEVTFTVTNQSDSTGSVSCELRARDADGIIVGGDQMQESIIAPNAREHYRILTGISAERVARVTVSC